MGEYKKYSLNVDKGIYHLYDGKKLCEEILKSTNFLNETKAKEQTLIDMKYKFCERCNKNTKKE